MEVVTRAAAASLPNKAEATSGMRGPGAACVDMCAPPEKFDTFCSGLGGPNVRVSRFIIIWTLLF
jgi:hypothetical protein